MPDIIESKSLAILYVSLSWQSAIARHVETFYGPLNVWRELELLPNSLARPLAGQRAGALLTASFAPGSLVPTYDESRVIVPARQFRPRPGGKLFSLLKRFVDNFSLENIILKEDGPGKLVSPSKRRIVPHNRY